MVVAVVVEVVVVVHVVLETRGSLVNVIDAMRAGSDSGPFLGVLNGRQCSR